MNCFWGGIIAILLHFAPDTGLGLSILNDAYDVLVIQDFKLNIYKSEESGENPISDKIRLVNFERDIYYSPEYNKSTSPGFWTPRILMGQSILKTITLGAKVVVVDFELSQPIPVYTYKEGQIDENVEFLNLLEKAAAAARKNNAVIIMARAQKIRSAGPYLDRYNEIFGQYSDVIKPGSSLAFSDPSDYQVRHFSFYESTETSQDALLSSHVLATVYLWYGQKEGTIILDQTVEKIKQGFEEITIPNPSIKRSGGITLFPQDPEKENLPARFLFRILQEDMTKALAKPNENVFVRHPNLMLRPDIVLSLKDDDKLYKDKIVIIGSTNPEMGDIHPTPLGEVPGVFLVANAINTLVSGLQINKPGLIFAVLLECCIIFISSLFFLHLSPKMAFFALWGIFFLASTSLSLYIFTKLGMFVDFWLPVLGIGLHKNISEIENFIVKKYAC